MVIHSKLFFPNKLNNASSLDFFPDEEAEALRHAFLVIG